ncbi:MAG: isochorismate synthase, partial [Proteobacteria bacterium]|nr:isochorismate synthase [Pseudomonadota bacterium]
EAADQARWFAELAQLRRALTDGFAAHAQPALVELAPSPGATYRAQVTAIVDAIADGRCAKIVAARTCELAFAGGVRVADLFASLDARHGECARVLVRPTPAGALLAATPERLVKKRGDLVECDALAGTATPEHAAALLASGKDRREHEHVISAIRDALAEAGDVVVEPTAIRALRHVLHLHAPIRATLRAPTHVLELVARLHPTPAVGGTPTRVAVDWIAAHEPTPRGWYAAPVGWFDLDVDGELAVAIRSGVITDDRAHLWAGAGIVAGSDPDRELVETENKLRAMLGALGVVG